MNIDENGTISTTRPEREIDDDLLMIAQLQGRPHDPVVFRELLRRGLLNRLERLEHAEAAVEGRKHERSPGHG